MSAIQKYRVDYRVANSKQWKNFAINVTDIIEAIGMVDHVIINGGHGDKACWAQVLDDNGDIVYQGGVLPVLFEDE